MINDVPKMYLSIFITSLDLSVPTIFQSLQPLLIFVTTQFNLLVEILSNFIDWCILTNTEILLGDWFFSVVPLIWWWIMSFFVGLQYQYWWETWKFPFDEFLQNFQYPSMIQIFFFHLLFPTLFLVDLGFDVVSNYLSKIRKTGSHTKTN